MNRTVFAGAAIAALIGAGAASAEPLSAGGVTAREMAAVLQARGLPATVAADNDGDPKIVSKMSGRDFQVYFYGCQSGRCGAIQYVLILATDDVSLGQINRWNTEHRYGRAYRGESGDALIEMDLPLKTGASTELVDYSLDVWESVSDAFSEFIVE